MLLAAAREGLSAPVNVTWETTLGCNLQCRHCLSAAGVPSDKELSTDECLAVLDELARLKVFQINVGGGEPFTRNDCFELLEYAQSLGIVCCVSTNGTLLDRDAYPRLAAMESLYLQVSLDGADPSVNDAIRGKGTYRKVLRALENLARLEIPFSINTVLTRLSFPQLGELQALARGFGAYLRVSRFRPAGRGKRTWKELSPTREQLEFFAGWLEQEPHVLTGDSFFSLTSENRRRMGLDMCGAAKMTCSLGPAGELYPCAFLQEERFLAGTIRESRLEDLWTHAPVFETFRGMEVRSCEWCHRFESCRGGCPAVAYHVHRDPARQDPECLQCILKRAESGER